MTNYIKVGSKRCITVSWQLPDLNPNELRHHRPETQEHLQGAAQRAMNLDSFNAAGLNLQAVFNLDELPPELGAALRACGNGHHYRQLIVLGHAGTALWDAVKADGVASDHPIDDFTVKIFQQWAAEHLAGSDYQIVYPGDALIGLQSLGKLAGWHHDSPLMLGINDRWGSWFAYRAAVLTDSDFAPTPQLATASPCPQCLAQPCRTHCPAGALDGEKFSLPKCAAFRLQPASPCQNLCLARLACPVASQHRYDAEQIRHTYSISLRWLRQGA
jgi:epoxyqueuosine reductase